MVSNVYMISTRVVMNVVGMCLCVYSVAYIVYSVGMIVCVLNLNACVWLYLCIGVCECVCLQCRTKGATNMRALHVNPSRYVSM